MSTRSASISTQQATQSAARDRRAFVRYPFSGDVICGSVAGEEVTWRGELRDFSVGGFSVSLARPCEVGAELLLELPPDLPSAPSMIPVRVVHVRRADNGRWITGCKILSFFGDTERRELCAKRADLP
jgi:hypothetical protein